MSSPARQLPTHACVYAPDRRLGGPQQRTSHHADPAGFVRCRWRLGREPGGNLNGGKNWQNR